MSFRLVVSTGPEAGKRANFANPVVTVGRGPKNDLVLQDGLVSQYHGEFLRRDWGWVYRDLRSRHGTLVKVNHVTVNLHDRAKPQEVTLIDGAELILGESLLRFGFEEEPDGGNVTDPLASLPAAVMTDTIQVIERERLKKDETIITRTSDSLEDVAKRLSRDDPRLVSIFKLSRKLNTTSDLDNILRLLTDATFEAFPAANFFAISLFPQGADQSDASAMVPLVSRERGQKDNAGSTPLLSSSLLQQVAQSRESVLFVRDDARPRNLSESIINARIHACLAAPLVGERGLIGVIQTDTRGRGGIFGVEDLDLFSVMASYAAFAIERVRLNTSIVEMFEGIVRASVTAIDARDPTTAGHSERVAQLTVALAKAADELSFGTLSEIQFSEDDLTELRYAALLHDFGKIGVRESVLTKAERLYPEQQKEIRTRFEAIRATRIMEVYRAAAQRLANAEPAARPEILVLTEQQATGVGKEVDEIRDFILEGQRSYFIDPTTIQRIRQVGQMFYTDVHGQRRLFLDDAEIEALIVPRGTLTESEWADMKAHAARSREYLAQIPWSDQLKNVPCIAGWHHEKLDGSGYPDGLLGHQIPHGVRILTVSDIFDALTAADRPYRKAIPISRAASILREEAARGLLDTDLVDLFVEAVLPIQLPFLRRPSQG